jgi:hypothetical protein
MRRAAIASILAAACFSDPPPANDGSTSGGAECPIGSVGCPCTSGGACDPGLECNPPDGPCFDPDCTPGTENCRCQDGQCLGAELMCSEGFCRMPMGGTSTTTSSETTSTSTAETDATLGMTGGVSTLDSTVTASETTLAESTTESVECTTCFAQAAPGCGAAMCLSCADALDCYVSGGAQCCELVTDNNAWNDLAGCIDTVCEQCTSIACGN